MRVGNDLAILGHEKLILQSDGEPAIKSLKGAVQADSSMKIEVSGRTGAPRDQIIKEESPAYDSRSNGYIESVIKSIQGKIRTMKDALESRLGLKIKDEHPSLPWLVRHAGFIRSRFHIDESGRSPYENGKAKASRRNWWNLGRELCITNQVSQESGRWKQDGNQEYG